MMTAPPQCSPLSSFLRTLVADQHRAGSSSTTPESVRLEIITDNARVPAFYERRGSSQCIRRSSSSESFFSAMRANVDAFESEYEEATSSKMVKQSNAKYTTCRWNSLERRPSLSGSSSAPASPTCPTRRTSIDEQGRENQERFPEMSLALAYLQDKYAGKQDKNKTSKVTTCTALEPCSKATAPTIPTRRASIDEFYTTKQAIAATLSITEQNNCSSSRNASARTEHSASTVVF
jgi:hypothetical protein